MPNGNSYFAMDLPLPLRDALDSVASRLAKETDNLPTPPATTPASQGTARKTAGEVVGRSLAAFAPMATELLHMTAYFAGEHLASLPAGRLESLHRELVAAVQATTAPCTLEFTGLELFPPGKNNLVVAVFRPSPGLSALQAAVEVHVRKAGVPDSDSARRADDHFDDRTGVQASAWVPHVTLGKIKASRAHVDSAGRQLLARCQQDAAHRIARASENHGAHTVERVVLLGAMPRRRWCDWDALVIAAPRD